MDQPKVSVCMVTYNHERYIAQAVESVLMQQTSFPIEIVVGEDFSTDNTPVILKDLAKQHPEKIRLRLADCNQGAKANFMGTLPECRGQYVAMLEGDDYWTNPTKLQSQIDQLDAHPEWAMCFHPTACVYEEGMQGQATYPLIWTKPEATLEDLLVANFIPTNSVVFRHRLFGEFPTWFRELKLGDWPLHILNAGHGNIGFLPEVMSAYRIHRGGIWNSETPAARVSAIFHMFRVVDQHFGGKYSAAIDEYRLAAIHGVMSEAESVKNSMATVVSELNKARATEATRKEDAADDVTIRNYWNQLVNEIMWLEHRYVVLAEENVHLREFRNTVRKSISYRVAREVRRPFVKLQELLYGKAPAPVAPPAPPADIPKPREIKSKAA